MELWSLFNLCTQLCHCVPCSACWMQQHFCNYSILLMLLWKQEQNSIYCYLQTCTSYRSITTKKKKINPISGHFHSWINSAPAMSHSYWKSLWSSETCQLFFFFLQCQIPAMQPHKAQAVLVWGAFVCQNRKLFTLPKPRVKWVSPLLTKLYYLM